MSLLQNSNAISTGGAYNLESSLRFRSSASAYLSRSLSTDGNRRTHTFSVWFKRGTLGVSQEWYFTNSGTGTFCQFYFTSSNTLGMASVTSSVADCNLITSQVFRDPSAWYHIVIAVDTTQATASNRIKMYVNGEQITSFSTSSYPAQNYQMQYNNSALEQNIGRPSTGTFDGYMTEFNFVDGQALTPSDFGETDTTTGVWKPKEYTGTYGTNGFYLPFTGEITPTVTAGRGGTAENVLYDDTNYLISNTSTGGAFDLIKYDFGESINMIDYNVQDLRWTGGTSTFKIYTSDDNSSWTERASLSVSSSYQNYTGNLGVTARYIKIRAAAFGTNGQAYLNYFNVDVDSSIFSDNSGNANNWTPNNINVVADMMNDVPTLTDEDTSNFATWNPLPPESESYSSGNLDLTGTSISNRIARTTVASNTGKFYWEYTITSASNTFFLIGVASLSATASGGVPSGNSVFYRHDNGYKYVNGTASSYGASWTTGDVIGVALDLDANTVVFYKNNTSQGSISLSADTYTPSVITNAASFHALSLNCGQRPFAYTPPTGYKKLNTYNLPDSTIADGSQYMNTVLYTGDGDVTSHPITGVGFSPDWIWIKRRDGANSHQTYDSVRTLGYVLSTDKTNAEADETSKFVSIDSDGFTIKSNAGSHNLLNATYVAWNWRGSDSSAVSNTDGTITSTVSANTDSGFSVVTYSGNGTNGATVGHGLGSAPKMVIVKQRNGSTYSWTVHHDSLTSGYVIALESTSAQFSRPTAFNSTAPNANTFTLGTDLGTNSSGGTYVAYCFAEVEGYSKSGSYTGNGSTDGPFVYTGFRPAFVMYKRTDNGTAGKDWVMMDTTRSTYNVIGTLLTANTANQESYYGSASYYVDFLSNGWKHRATGSAGNASGGTYIYMAFAENPFKHSLAR